MEEPPALTKYTPPRAINDLPVVRLGAKNFEDIIDESDEDQTEKIVKRNIDLEKKTDSVKVEIKLTAKTEVDQIPVEKKSELPRVIKDIVSDLSNNPKKDVKTVPVEAPSRRPRIKRPFLKVESVLENDTQKSENATSQLKDLTETSNPIAKEKFEAKQTIIVVPSKEILVEDVTKIPLPQTDASIVGNVQIEKVSTTIDESELNLDDIPLPDTMPSNIIIDPIQSSSAKHEIHSEKEKEIEPPIFDLDQIPLPSDVVEAVPIDEPIKELTVSTAEKSDIEKVEREIEPKKVVVESEIVPEEAKIPSASTKLENDAQPVGLFEVDLNEIPLPPTPTDTENPVDLDATESETIHESIQVCIFCSFEYYFTLKIDFHSNFCLYRWSRKNQKKCRLLHRKNLIIFLFLHKNLLVTKNSLIQRLKRHQLIKNLLNAW